MLDADKIKNLEKLATQIRLEAMRAFHCLGFGHVGGSMSVADLLAVLYGEIMKIDPGNPAWPDRDWFILSKGHAGPALYAALGLQGYFPLTELATLNKPRTCFPSHCDRNKTPGVDMTTGSLGQGMSTAIGVALGNLLDGRNNYTFLVLGDGECDEGQVWEGALFARQHKLYNLIAFVDYNKKQLDGYTKDICDIGDIAGKFNEFGWFCQNIDGHDIGEIYSAIRNAQAQREKPAMIVLNTSKGKGCSFADVLFNHHMNFSKEQSNEAIALLEAELAKYN